MTGYAFLRSRRWLGIACLTVVVAAVCVVLGSWQLSRHEYRAAAIARVQANTQYPPVPLTELLATPEASVGDELEWRTVTVTGRYVGQPVALPQRGTESGPADHALAVLAVTGTAGTDGTAAAPWLLVIDRGSYPTDAFADDTGLLALPSGEVEVELRLRPAEPPSPRQPIAGQVFRVAPQQVLDAAAAGTPLEGTLMVGGYGWLVSETPTTADPPAPLAVPAPDYRSNLSYAFQWWTFALLAFVGFGVLARREQRTLALEAGGAAATPPPVRRRRRSDADLEDAEIDAAELAAAGADQARDTSSA